MKLFKLFSLIFILIVFIVVIPGCKTGGGEDNTIPPSTARMLIVDYDGSTPLTSGTILTDVNSYTIDGQPITVEFSVYKSEAIINVPGYVQRTTRLNDPDKTYIMVPIEWGPFFSDSNVAGQTRGTHRFDEDLKVYIDGPEGDPDRATIESSLRRIPRPTIGYSYVNSESEANFIFRLNSDRNTHAENVSNGIISKTTINLKDDVGQNVSDEELAQGLLHVGDSGTATPGFVSSCIAGSHLGWIESVDRPIMRAFYNRNHSKFNQDVESEID